MLLLLAVAGPADAAPCENANATPAQIGKAQAEKSIRCLVNKKRRAQGLRALKKRKPLVKAARAHSRAMRRKGCFSHRCQGEPSLAGRLKRAGYLPCGCSYAYGETLAWAPGSRATPAKIVASWVQSPAHSAVMFDRSFRDFGIGVVNGTPSDPNASGRLVTGVFGYRR